MSDKQCNIKKRNSHVHLETPTFIEAKKRKGRLQSKTQPRWHNQAFMLYLALRQHSENHMVRIDLVKQGLAVDQKISQTHMLPKVFRGKTPMNSASACLTNNADGYFVSFKPEDSRWLHFKLSSEPATFESAFREYQKWQEDLATYDWPYRFGPEQHTRKRKSVMSIENLVEQLDVKYPTEFDEFIAKRRRQEQITKEETLLPCEAAPTSWKDLVYVDLERRGVFTKRHLPRGTPLGFYFGVPTLEDEFEALKEHEALRYAYMYQNTTVIDPTDKNGELYKDICPFYHVRNTGSSEKANVIFYEGEQKNQIVCWTKKGIPPNQELLFYSEDHNTPFHYKYLFFGKALMELHTPIHTEQQ